MKSHTWAGSRRAIAVLTAIMMLLSVLSVQTILVSAADTNVYCKQIGRGKCTLASATMMMRQKAKNEGSRTWTSISQQSIRSSAWIEGAGLRHSFSYAGMTVSYGNFTSSNKLAQVRAILAKHPEGFVIYERALPHAIFLTRYNSGTGTFYCADPALTASERTLSSSYLRHISRSKTQSAVQKDIINGLDSYWYVSRYNSKSAAAFDRDTLNGEISKSANDKNKNNTSTASGDRNTNINTQPADKGQTQPVENPPVNDDQTVTDDPVTDDNQTSVDDPVQEQDDSGVVDDSAVDNQDTNEEIAQGTDTNGGVVGDDDSASQTDTNAGTVDSSGAIVVKFDTVSDFSGVSFSDVSQGDWFYSYVKAAYETGLMSGMSSQLFGVNGDTTLAQTVTVAARIHAIENEFYGAEFPDFTPLKGETWYDPYNDYAYSEGIIGTKYYSMIQKAPNRKATRLQFAEIMSGALTDDFLTEINSVSNGFIKDVNENTPSGRHIYKLYRAGILAGNPDGTYRPSSTITRAEVAAIIARMADSRLRVRF